MLKLRKTVLAGLLSAVVALSCFIVTPVSVMAAEISVYLDGERLVYKDPEALPQILNDRTMVPLRETAEYFGMEFTWNAETSTMVFVGRGRTVIHTVNSDTIYVNGEAFTYTFRSAIINDRTMMPIRMLAEAIGCEVEWIGETATVNIYSEYYSGNDTPSAPVSTPTPTPTPTPVASAAVSIYAATASPTSVEEGEEVTITISTNRSATKAKVTDSNGNTYDETTDYTEDSQGRYFTFYIPLSDEGNNSLRVYAGNDSSYSSSYKILNVTVNKDTAKIQVIAIDIEETDLSDGDKVEGIVRTSRNAVKIVVKDSDNKVLKTVTQEDYRSSVYKDWSFDFDIDADDNDDEKLTYYVYAYDEKNKEASGSFTINLEKESGGSSSNGPEISRVNFDYTQDGIYYEAVFTVRADETAVEVELYDDNGSRMTATDSYSGSSTHVFTLEYSTDDYTTRTYTVRVYNSDRKYTVQEVELDFD